MSKLRVDQLETLDGTSTVDVKDLKGVTAQSLVLKQQKSGNFWDDVHPQAKIHRINDRAFFGAGADNDGKITTDRVPGNKDWLEILRPSTSNNTQLLAISTIGQCAILGAARSSDFGQADSMGCIGGQFWGINDNTEHVQTVYGAYLEVRRNVGTGRTHGFELDVVNYGNAVSVQPYDMFQQGLTVGGWLASGGEIAATRASAALAIINNGSSWEKGIVFHSIALDGTNGITGNGIAIEMAKGHVIRWMYGSGSQGAGITSSVSNSMAEQSLQFSDLGLLFRNAANKDMFKVGVSSTAVNGISIAPGTAGVAPSVNAAGDDTNINLTLLPKGTGIVNLAGAQVTGAAGTQAGYVLFGINGTTFKLPYFNL